VKASTARTPTAKEIRRRFPDNYTSFHARRYMFLLDTISRLLPDGDRRILDIGRSTFTTLLREQVPAEVDTLGFQPDSDTPQDRNFHFDLNDAQHEEKWRDDLGPYDAVVMAEVIEHLYTSPSLVLGFVNSLLRPGGLLFLQTPNAAALNHRFKLLLGRNPYHLISENNTNPMHFREYTVKELTRYGRGAGFEVVECALESYFERPFSLRTTGDVAKSHWYAIGYRYLPPPLRTGITMVLRRTKPQSA